MFKVGDRVKLKKNISNYYTYAKENEIYEILKMDSRNKMWLENISKESGHWYITADFNLAKEKIVNDIDWLNAIQQNFKEGV